MKITVLGAGYVGLVSGACFAEVGHEVVCIDVDAAKVDRINSGDAPIYEDGLDELLTRNVANGRLRASTDLVSAVRASDLTMIAVGTPFDGENIDLTYIRTAARQIGEALRDHDGYHVVVVKSTVVPGTTTSVVAPMVAEASGKQAGVDVGIGMNPEFLREGTAVADFMQPDRIVIGADNERTASIMKGLYEPFPTVPVVVTTPSTAESIKYASNSLFAMLISFSNEIADVCEAVGDVDAIEVMKGVHLDRRITPFVGDGRVTAPLAAFLLPGTGFGGSCFPKDLAALVAFGEQRDVPMRLLRATIDSNVVRPLHTVDLARDALGGPLDGRRVTVLGLAFKPDTDDVRESPAITILQALVREGAIVTAHDPIAISSMQHVIDDPTINYEPDLNEAIRHAECVVLVTRWSEYSKVPDLMPAGVPIIDGRRMLDPTTAGYRGIGFRPTT